MVRLGGCGHAANQMRPSRLLLVLALVHWTWPVLSNMNCDWHGQIGVNYSKSPWTFKIHPDCSTLELEVHLWGAMGTDGSMALGKSIQKMKRLKRLDLDHNHIGDEGMSALSKAMEHMDQLAAIDLKGNSIGDHGAQALAAELRHTPQLTHLNVASNAIGPGGARSLAAALRKTPMITLLVLSHNQIGDEGAKAVASVLRHMPGLLGLEVSKNNLSDEGERALAAAVAAVEAGRGRMPFQHVYGVSELYLNEARSNHPKAPMDILENPGVLTRLPIWRFLNNTCGMSKDVHGIDAVVMMLAALGVQELPDLSLWTDQELDRNLERAGILKFVRSNLSTCVNQHMREQTTKQPWRSEEM
mmetsp:Transcript_160089/g.292265  ORF Transcript_160089/g.292265 Transcript_160089/m.292265 type:complete len:358 (+) Transcript_160089:42-1115(+)